MSSLTPDEVGKKNSEGSTPTRTHQTANEYSTTDSFGESADCNEQFLQLFKTLYQLLANPHEDFQPQINQYIELGLGWYGLKRCIISRVSNGIYTVISTNIEPSILTASKQISINETLCVDVLEGNGTISIQKHNATKRASVGYYNGQIIESYIGGVLVVNNRVYGTLCFFSDIEKATAFTATDHDVLELISTGVSRSIELNSQSPTPFQFTGSSGHLEPPEALHGDKLKLYSDQSFPHEAVGCLVKRIGHSQLSIANLAEDMALSTRTLQRRLKQNNISFGELRDHVRYRYAITHLIDKNVSIDGIASALDFSDRTSFTSAFKRWTGLSPSTFRKVYKQYN